MTSPAAVGRLVTLKKRSEFLRIRGGARFAARSFMMEARPRDGTVAPAGSAVADAVSVPADDAPLQQQADAGPRFGFIVTKKLGNAVVRNRIRRRIREALRQLPKETPCASCDYVLIARAGALTQQFPDLVADLTKAFQRIAAALEGKFTGRKTKPAQGTSGKSPSK